MKRELRAKDEMLRAAQNDRRALMRALASIPRPIPPSRRQFFRRLVAGAIGSAVLPLGAAVVANIYCNADEIGREIGGCLLRIRHALDLDDFEQAHGAAVDLARVSARHPNQYARAINQLGCVLCDMGHLNEGADQFGSLLLHPDHYELTKYQYWCVRDNYFLAAYGADMSSRTGGHEHLDRFAKLYPQLQSSCDLASQKDANLEGWRLLHSRRDWGWYVPPNQVAARVELANGSVARAHDLFVAEIQEPDSYGPRFMAAWLSCHPVLVGIGGRASRERQLQARLNITDSLPSNPNVAAHMRPVRALTVALLEDPEALPELDFGPQSRARTAERYLRASIADIRTIFAKGDAIMQHAGRHYARSVATAYAQAADEAESPSVSGESGHLLQIVRQLG
jgi:hypothetical protein